MVWPGALARLDELVAATFDDVAATARARTKGAGVNSGDVDDATREPFAFQCSLSLAPPPAPKGEIADPAIRATVGVSYAAVITANKSAWPWEPGRGDLIDAGDRLWIIASTVRHGSGRFIAYVNRTQ